MINASDFEGIKHDKKMEKFNKLMEIQEKFIRENMQKGKRSVLWIFSDKEYYIDDFEKQWFEEFYHKAKEYFEMQGFVIKGIIINW